MEDKKAKSIQNLAGSFSDRDMAIRYAKAHEQETGCTCYIVRDYLSRGYVLSETCPNIGEFYTTDGIRHG